MKRFASLQIFFFFFWDLTKGIFAEINTFDLDWNDAKNVNQKL